MKIADVLAILMCAGLPSAKGQDLHSAIAGRYLCHEQLVVNCPCKVPRLIYHYPFFTAIGHQSRLRDLSLLDFASSLAFTCVSLRAVWISHVPEGSCWSRADSLNICRKDLGTRSSLIESDRFAPNLWPDI